MADISVTATAVLPATGTTILSGIAGGTITAGQPIYEDGANGSVLKAAQADAAATGVKANVVGIALNGGATGQRIQYIKTGNLTLNAVLVAGGVYVVSAAAAGGIAPIADLGSTHYTTVLGIAISTTVLKVNIQAGGVQRT